MGWARYLVVVAIALGACGDESTPGLDEITRELADQVAEQTGTQDVLVVCPDDVAEGDVCDVTAKGGLKAKIRVTRLDDDDVEGQIVQP